MLRREEGFLYLPRRKKMATRGVSIAMEKKNPDLN